MIGSLTDGADVEPCVAGTKSVHETENAQQFVEDLIDGVDKSLPKSVTLALRDILFRYSDVFSKSDGDINLTTENSH